MRRFGAGVIVGVAAILAWAFTRDREPLPCMCDICVSMRERAARVSR